LARRFGRYIVQSVRSFVIVYFVVVLSQSCSCCHDDWIL